MCRIGTYKPKLGTPEKRGAKYPGKKWIKIWLASDTDFIRSSTFGFVTHMGDPIKPANSPECISPQTVALHVETFPFERCLTLWRVYLQSALTSLTQWEGNHRITMGAWAVHLFSQTLSVCKEKTGFPLVQISHSEESCVQPGSLFTCRYVYPGFTCSPKFAQSLSRYNACNETVHSPSRTDYDGPAKMDSYIPK